MNLESITHLAKSADKPKKPEKSQAELRAVLDQRLNSLKPTLKEGIKEYEEALKNNLFEDQKDEPEGAGEARKEALQNKLTALVDRAEKMKASLDSKEILPQATPEISAQYTRPDGKAETIALDLEAKLQDFLSFYQTTNIDLPPDFEDNVRDIWERNHDQMAEAIEQNGFDEMLIIPGNIPLPDLAEKMKMENGYYFYQVKEDFSNVKSQNVDKSRIILFHHADSLPEIAQKTGLDIHLNITGAEAQKLYKLNPDHCLSTLEDAIVLERKYFEETGKHLSDWNQKSAQWLPGSIAGAHLVNSHWHPGARRLGVDADGLEDQDGSLGVRPSRCFF